MPRFTTNRLGFCEQQDETAVTTSGQADAPQPTIGQRLSAALSSKASLTAKIAEHEQTIAARDADIGAKDAEITQLKADLAARDEEITQLKADAQEVADALAAHQKETAELKAKDQTLDERAAAKSKEKLAALGIKSTDLPKSEPGAAETPKKTRAEFDKLDAAAREEFMRAGGRIVHGDN